MRIDNTFVFGKLNNFCWFVVRIEQDMVFTKVKYNKAYGQSVSTSRSAN